MHEHLHDVDAKAVLGVGFWLLVSAFAARAVSMTALLVTTVVVAVGVPLLAIWLVLALFGCGSAGVVVVRGVGGLYVLK